MIKLENLRASRLIEAKNKQVKILSWCIHHCIALHVNQFCVGSSQFSQARSHAIRQPQPYMDIYESMSPHNFYEVRTLWLFDSWMHFDPSVPTKSMRENPNIVQFYIALAVCALSILRPKTSRKAPSCWKGLVFCCKVGKASLSFLNGF